MESNSQADCKRALLVELSRAPFHLLKSYRKPDGKKTYFDFGKEQD